MSVSNERFNSQLQLIWHHIRNINEKFGPLFLHEIESSTRNIILGNHSAFIDQIEQNTATIDWGNLEIWIQNATEFIRYKHQWALSCLTVWGYNAQNVDWLDVMARDPVELLQASPAGQYLRRHFGPNWSSGFTALSRLSPAATPGNILDPETFQKLTSIRTQKIVDDWIDIRKDSGGRSSFRKGWSKLTRLARKEWLQDQRCIPTEPHSHIYTWARSLEAGDQLGGRRLFLSSLLNIEDLSDGNVLPDFLDARAMTHPRLFRHSDSPSVAIGVYTDHLLSKCVPEMIASFDSEADDTNRYSVSLQRSVIVEGASLPSNPFEEPPGIALLQLEAQQRIYEFLAGCLIDGRNGFLYKTVDQPPCNHDNGVRPSLLTRAMRLDYYGRPGTLDLTYLWNIVNASLDEACEDLWLLRQDCEAWINRLVETPRTQSGSTSNLLGVVLGRIDAFHTLKHRLLALKQYKSFENQNIELVIKDFSEDREGLRLLMSMHVAFVSVLEEHLCRLTRILWPANSTDGPVLFKLLELLKNNDPTLRILGLPAVMRVIEREMETSDVKESANFTMMQALNDISVLAGCLDESVKHCNLVSHFREHISLGNKLENEWKDHHRPWASIFENTLTALGERKSKELNRYINSRNINAKTRFRDFWTTIDQHMAISSQGNLTNEKLIHEILQTAPVNMLQSDSEPAMADWVGKLMAEPRITSTMLKRSRRHPALTAEIVTPTPLKTRQAQTLPVIKPSKDKWFWIALSSPSSENCSELSWSDFEKAMVGIGYEMYRHGGAGRRFEYGKGSTSRCASQGTPGTIVFHEPHGKGGKVSHRLAQSLWLRRLQQRFRLEL